MKRKQQDNSPLVITQEVWMNGYLSVARHYGRVNVYGHDYWIVDKFGRDVYECTHLANKYGWDKAIPAGEPADLCRRDFMKTYRKLGRDKVIELLKQGKSKEEIDEYAKSINEEKEEKEVKTAQLDLFGQQT